jgi:hypothetical protein
MTKSGSWRALVSVIGLSLGLAACTSAAMQSSRVVYLNGAQLAHLQASSSALTATKSARLSVSFSSRAETATGTGVIDLQHKAMQLHLANKTARGTARFEERLVDGTVYLELPPHSVPGFDWIRIASGVITGDELAQLGAGSNDPSAQAAVLRHLNHVVLVGHETIAGVQTTHYTGIADFATALATAKVKLGASSPVTKELEHEITVFHAGRLPVSVWIDDQNQPRRMTLTIIVKGDPLHFTYNFSDFGVAVNIQAPPAGAVQDLAKFTAAIAAAGSTQTASTTSSSSPSV